MTTFAVIENGIVINSIIADSKSIAEQLTGKTCVDPKDVINHIGYTYNSTTKVFTAPQPYPSWTLENNIWVAPIPQPTEATPSNLGYYWNEETLSWVEIVVE